MEGVSEGKGRGVRQEGRQQARGTEGERGVHLGLLRKF